MHTKYPKAIDDSISLPFINDLRSPVNPEIVNNLRAAILSLENELGINPSGSFKNLNLRIENIESKINSTLGKISISSNDKSPNDLEYKIVGGNNITISKINVGGDEKLKISASSSSLKDDSKESHSIEHEKGGIDEILVQNLSSGYVPENLFLQSDGYGGLTFSALDINHNKTHEQFGEDPLIVQHLSSGDIEANKTLVSDGLGSWSLVDFNYNTKNILFIPVLSGLESTCNTIPTTKGAFIFNLSDYLDYNFIFECILQVTNPDVTGYIELILTKDESKILELKSNSLDPEILSCELPLNHLDLRDNCIIECRLRVGQPNNYESPPGVFCKHARLKLTRE